MIAPVSICMIVKNEGPRLDRCLSIIRPYVAEIIIVDTGSTDNSPEIAKKYADIFEIFTDCNDPETGFIADFSMARNRSFDLANQPYLMWQDSDDIIKGIENLPNIINELEQIKDNKPKAVLFPYEYSHDSNGNVRVKQFRERLFYNKKSFFWQNKIHEVVNFVDPNTLVHKREDIVWVHNRGDKQVEPNRNYRIIKKVVEDMEKSGNIDARQYYYACLEHFNVGENEKAIELANKYISISGWSDEINCCLHRLGTYYLSIGNYDKVIETALKAIAQQECWSENYLMLSKAYYLMADTGKDPIRNYQKCVNFAKQGLSFPPTQTLLFVDPMDRAYEIHKFLNVALSKLGDIEGALESCLKGLAANPEDPWLIGNKKAYQKHLNRLKFNKETAEMLSCEGISQDQYSEIMAVLDNPENSNIGWPSYNKSPTYPNGILPEQFPVATVSPHSQAWGIPNTWEIDDLPVKMTDQQLQSTVIMMWREYILNDEILSAIKFLEHAPYRVRHTAATEEALKRTQNFITWIDNDVTAQKHNSPANTAVESGMPLPRKLEAQEGGRFNLIANNLPKKPVKIIDFGCSDGGFTNRYGMLGHDVTGLDLSETSVALANKKAEEFNTRAKHIVTYFQDADKKISEKFDYVTSSDTYEHLRNSDEMLVPAKNLLKEDGKFLLVTPYGAWMRGNYLEWAHPWVYAKEGKGSWLNGNPRAHLIAPTQWSVAKDFQDNGFWVKNCYPVLCDPIKDVEGQGNIFCEGLMQGPKCEKPLDIAFFIGDGLEIWDPRTIKKNGVGGSEYMAMQQAKNLANLGHRVRVFAGVGEHGEGIYDGVEYYLTNKCINIKCDIYIVSRICNMLDDVYAEAELKLLWLHDVVPVNWKNRLLLKADRILCLSNWHKNNVIKECNVHPDQIIVTRNGVDLERFDKEIKRNKYKVINSSSPDRSFNVLLNYWNEIKTKVPQAELHLFYGFNNMEKMAPFNLNIANDLIFLKNKLNEMKDSGVIFHGRVNHERLAEEFLSAGIWAYPTAFFETSCVSGMESLIGGAKCITSDRGALSETIINGIKIPGDCNSEEYKKIFIDEMVKALTNEMDDIERKEIQNLAKQKFDIKLLAKEWENMFYKLLEEKQINPCISYQPTIGF